MRRSVFFTLGALLSLGFAERSAEATDPSDRAERLARILRDDSSFKIRALAAKRLGALLERDRHPNKTAVRALVDGLADDNEFVRGVCAHALAGHVDRGTKSRLERVATDDSSRAVRVAARKSADRIGKHLELRRSIAREGRRVKIELGRVELARDPSTNADLVHAIRNAIEDRIEPHRPAIMPRESANVRIDVIVARVTSEPGAAQIGFEARVVLIELPGANLRHASIATASTKGSRRRGKKREELEQRLALQAVNRAVDEALFSLLGSNG